MQIPDIMLIHGAGGGAWQWRDWIKVIKNYEIQYYAPDLMPVEAGLASTHFRDYVSQIAETVKSLPSPPILVGASMGGMIAMKIAEMFTPPALVLVNSVPPAATESWHQRRIRFPDVITWSSSATLDETRRSMPEASEETVRWVHSNWRDESGLVMRMLYHGIPATTPKTPTLIISSSLDRSVKPMVGEELAKRFGADFICFDGVSHVGALLGRRSTFVARTSMEWIISVLEMKDGAPYVI